MLVLKSLSAAIAACPAWTAAAAFAVAPQASGQAAPGLSWERRLDHARDRAALEQKPLLVCVMNDGEPACRQMLAQVYPAAEVQKRLASFVLVACSASTHELVEIEVDGEPFLCCKAFRGVLCSEHQAIERELRPAFLDEKQGGVVVPQHAVFGPEGTLLIRREFAMQRGPFEKFLADALALAREAPAARRADRGKPHWMLVDVVLAANSAEDREAAAKQLLADHSPEREEALLECVALLETPLERGLVVRAAGDRDHAAWAPCIARLLAHEDAHVRRCAAVTLEEQAEPSAGPALLARLEVEKDPGARIDLLRALGPCGHGSAEARGLLLAELSSKRAGHPEAAALSLGWFLRGDDEVAKALAKAWKRAGDERMRLAIAWGIGASEDPAQVPLLEDLTADERSENVQRVAYVVRTRLEKGAAAARLVLGRGGPARLRQALAPLFGDDVVPRHDLFDASRGEHPDAEAPEDGGAPAP